MSLSNSKTLILAAAFAAFGAAASAATLGEQVANGSVSEAAFNQLVSGSGLSSSEAREMTIDQVLQIKHKDD